MSAGTGSDPYSDHVTAALRDDDKRRLDALDSGFDRLDGSPGEVSRNVPWAQVDDAVVRLASVYRERPEIAVVGQNDPALFAGVVEDRDVTCPDEAVVVNGTNVFTLVAQAPNQVGMDILVGKSARSSGLMPTA